MDVVKLKIFKSISMYTSVGPITAELFATELNTVKLIRAEPSIVEFMPAQSNFELSTYQYAIRHQTPC